MSEVRVTRNPVKADTERWFVRCGYCKPGFMSWFAPIAWAADWQIAQDWAVKHALAHEATRCTTCLHVPERVLVEENA